MPDPTDDRFRSLDDVPAPDLWPDASAREPGPERGGAQGRRLGAAVSVGALVVLVGVVALLARNLTASDSPVGPVASADATPSGSGPSVTAGPTTTSLPPHPGAQPRSVFGVDAEGSVRCSASIDSEVLEPGDTLSVSFAIENLGDRSVQYTSGPSGDHGTIKLIGRGEHPVWDQLHADEFVHSMPPPSHEELAPGERAPLSTTTVVIRWPGPLDLAAACPLGIGALEPVPLNIVTPGSTPSTAEAVSRAVDATGGLYADCAPGPSGQSVVGLMTPPGSATGALPLRALCWADLRVEEGLVGVTLHFASPPEAGMIPVSGVLGFGGPRDGPVEASTWEFVVTARGAFRVDDMQSASRSGPDLWAVDYAFDGASWTSGDCTTPGTESFGGGVTFFQPDSCF